MSETPDTQAQDTPADAPAPAAAPALATMDDALAALPKDHTILIALRDGFKDEAGIYREKWQPVVVTAAFARRLTQADRTLRTLDEIRAMIARSASKVELRNCCRHAGIEFAGSLHRDDFGAKLIAYLDRTVSAAVTHFLAPDKGDKDLATDHATSTDHADRPPRSSKSKSARANAPAQIEGEHKPPTQIENV